MPADDIDLALTYDYSLAPAGSDPTVETTQPLVPAVESRGSVPALRRAVPETRWPSLPRTPTNTWIGNSRNSADEEVVRLLGGMAGFEPRVAHQCDSLELVQDLIVAGYGVGMLPSDLEAATGRRARPARRP